MSIIVEAVVPAEEFTLAETLAGTGNETFRPLGLVAHESDRPMPFLWVDCDDERRLRRSMADDPSVRGLSVLEAFDGHCLLEVEWDPRLGDLLSALRAEGALVLGASAQGSVWRLRMYLPDPGRVSNVKRRCEELAMDATLEVETDLTGTTESGYFGLTECQYETLVRASELGYYDVPRGISQAELADLFGISHQALSERLRRAHGTLVANGLHQVAHRRDRSVPPRVHDRIEI